MESFIPRIGGKRLLRKTILTFFPEKIERYVEPFGGAGWLLFSRDKHAPEEIFNDLDSELINLFRCVQNHTEELQKQIALLLNSRELFEDAMALKKVRGLTDIQKAALHFTVIKQSYGADCRTYGAAAKNIDRVAEYLHKVRQRLMMVKIENRPFDIVLQQYDKVGTLFYLDPPYHGTESMYEASFTGHTQLHDILVNIKGKFVLSYNDDRFIRDIYRDFDIHSVSRNSNLANRYPSHKKDYKELIIKNF